MEWKSKTFNQKEIFEGGETKKPKYKLNEKNISYFSFAICNNCIMQEK